MDSKKSEKLGQYIKEKRVNKKVTGKEFGELVGYSQSYISALENNRNKNIPNRNVLYNIATALSLIGYDFDTTLAELHAIAGYNTNSFVSEEQEKEMIQEFNKLRGMYDNVHNVKVKYPYMKLSYLLEKDFELYYDFEIDGTSHTLKLNKSQKQFLDKVIENLLIKDGAIEDIRKMRDESIETAHKTEIEIHLANEIDEARNIHNELRALKENFNSDTFKSIMEKYNPNFKHEKEFYTYDRLEYFLKVTKDKIKENTVNIEKLWEDDTND